MPELDPNDPRRTIRLDDVRRLGPKFKEHADPRQDAGIFFQSELEHIIKQTYEVKQPQLKMANGEILPIRSTVPRGMKSWAYEMYEPIGLAKFMTAASWRDVPRSDVSGTKTTGTVEPFASGYGYNLDDIEQAQAAGKPLEQWKANATRRAFDVLVNETGISGNGKLKLEGFVNHSNIPILDAGAGTAGAIRWDATSSKKTGQEMVDDLHEMVDTVKDLTGNVEVVSRFGLSPSFMRVASRTRLGAELSRSVLTVFQEDMAKQGVQVSFYELNELATASATGTPAIIAHAPNPDALWLEMPIPFEQHGPFEDGLEYGVIVRGSTGGVICVYPFSMVRMDFANV